MAPEWIQMVLVATTVTISVTLLARIVEEVDVSRLKWMTNGPLWAGNKKGGFNMPIELEVDEDYLRDLDNK